MNIQVIDRTPADDPQDTLSFTRYRAVPVKVECPECPTEVCDDCCPAEIGGARYAANGDKIYLQYAFEDLVNDDPTAPTKGWKRDGDAEGDYWLALSIHDENGQDLFAGQNINDIADAWSVYHNGNQSLQNVVLDASKIFATGASCFFVRVEVFFPSWSEFINIENATNELPSDLSPYEEGDLIYVGGLIYRLDNGAWVVDSVISDGDYFYNSANGVWFIYDNSIPDAVKVDSPVTVDDLVGNSITCNSGLYKKVRCEDTILITSDRTSGRDCKGIFYGFPTGEAIQNDSRYRLNFRLQGSIEPIAYPISREVTEDGVTVGGSYSERARLRTAGVCRYDAELLAAVLASESFFIEGESWETATDVEKNNENGNLWWIDVTLEREICSGVDDCDFRFE